MAGHIPPGLDDRYTEVTERWDGDDYSGQEFVPDSPDPLTALESDYRGLGELADHAADLLTGAVPAGWTGAAAVAYQQYLQRTQEYLHTVSDATHAAALACRGCHAGLATAVQQAARAATTCNNARADHAKAAAEMKKAEHEFLLNPGRWVDEWHASDHADDAESQLKKGLAAGRTAQESARDAYTALIKALDQADNTLATQAEPAIPGAATMPDAGNAGLLAAIMAPVTAALASDGDTQRARRAVDQYDQAMRDDPTGKKAKELLATLASELSGPELDYLLDHADENDLAATFGQFDPTKDRDLYNLLAGKLSLDVANRIADTDPNHYWHPANGTDKYIWQTTNGTDGVVPPTTLADLHQGMLGDCHDLATLAALLKVDPSFLANHVQANANGTYTVTLYKDGKPVAVTVTPDVPFTANADGSPGMVAYSHQDPDWGSNRTVFQLYEKALAQSNAEIGPDHRTGYDGMNGGYPDKDMTVITGTAGSSTSSGDVAPTTISDAMGHGHPVTVTTLSDSDAGGKALYDEHRVPHLIAGHAYYVDHVDTSTSPATVTLVNPWGAESSTDGTVTLSWNDYQKYTSGTQIGK